MLGIITVLPAAHPDPQREGVATRCVRNATQVTLGASRGASKYCFARESVESAGEEAREGMRARGADRRGASEGRARRIDQSSLAPPQLSTVKSRVLTQVQVYYLMSTLVPSST